MVLMTLTVMVIVTQFQRPLPLEGGALGVPEVRELQEAGRALEELVVLEEKEEQQA